MQLGLKLIYSFATALIGWETIKREKDTPWLLLSTQWMRLKLGSRPELEKGLRTG
jgi:hypothetical protein